MQTRYFSSLSREVSLFGLGTMRMPTMAANGKTVMDRDKCVDMIRTAIDSGVTYVDTAYPYHGGESETTVGFALENGYRARTALTSKLPVWLVQKPEDADRLLDEQLKKLRTDHLDFYFLHALNRGEWDRMRAMNVLSVLERAKAEGRIRHIGFSFHDSYDVFREIVDFYPWELVQIQLNYLDRDFQAGVRGVAYLREKGIPCSIMEPLKGGKLAVPGNATIAGLWESYPVRRSAVEWAFRWLADIEGVNVILSGSSSMEQMLDSIAIFSKPDMAPGCLSDDERELISRVRAEYHKKLFIQCTACGYCQPCPRGVDIPQMFRYMNDGALAGSWARTREHYADLVADEADPGRCVRCGACETHCPQHLPIRDKLAEARALLEV